MMNTSKMARLFLGANSVFSLLCGLSFLLVTEWMVTILFIELAEWQTLSLQIIGVGLLIFAAELVWMASKRTITYREVAIISMMDVGWVVGSAILLVFGGSLFTSTGQFIVVDIAIFVLIFAIGQYLGAKKIQPAESQSQVFKQGEPLS